MSVFGLRGAQGAGHRRSAGPRAGDGRGARAGRGGGRRRRRAGRRRLAGREGDRGGAAARRTSCTSTSPTRPAGRPGSPRPSRRSAGSTSWSTTPASRSARWSSTSTRPTSGRCSRSTCSAPCSGVKHGLRAMRPGGAAGTGGSIINISSVAATIAFPGISAYSATKSAVDRLTRVAAAESGKLGYGVRVNCIYPGPGPHRDGRPARRGHGDARAVPERRRRPPARSSR